MWRGTYLRIGTGDTLAKMHCTVEVAWYRVDVGAESNKSGSWGNSDNRSHAAVSVRHTSRDESLVSPSQNFHFETETLLKQQQQHRAKLYKTIVVAVD